MTDSTLTSAAEAVRDLENDWRIPTSDALAEIKAVLTTSDALSINPATMYALGRGGFDSVVLARGVRVVGAGDTSVVTSTCIELLDPNGVTVIMPKDITQDEARKRLKKLVKRLKDTPDLWVPPADDPEELPF